MNNNEMKNKIGYQIFPLSFNDANNDGIGDLKGIENKLEYLKELGVDIIWLCPIYKSNFVDAGYDVIDYCKIDSRFGTMKDFNSLMKKAKSLGIDIMLDLVVNHASIDSKEFKKACKSRNNKYHDFFMWQDKPNISNESIFGNSAWEYVESVDQYYLHIFTKEQADFNFHSDKFKKWLCNILKFWIKKGVKYFRFDAIEHIGKTTDPYVIRYGKYNYEFLSEIVNKIKSKYDVYIVGESWNVKQDIMRKYSNQDKIVDSFFNFSNLFFDWKNKNGALAKNKNDVDFRDLKGYFEWQTNDLLTSTSWTNHDVPRAVDRYLKPSIKNRYYAQTALTTLLMTTRGIPFLYQGEEFGMSYADIKSFKDFTDSQIFSRMKNFMKENKYTKEEYFKANATGSRDLSRSIMAWDDSKNSGFCNQEAKPIYVKSANYKNINAKKDLSSSQSIYKFTKKIIELRKTIYSDFFTSFDNLKIMKLDKKITIYKLIKNKKQIIVAINWSNKTIKCSKKIKEIVLSNYNYNMVDKLTLKPFEATIYVEGK